MITADASIQTRIEIPSSEMHAFESLLQDLIRETGRAAPDVVEQASVFFCKGCAVVIPISAKKRPIWYKYGLGPPGQETSSKARDGRWPVVTIYTQHKPPHDVSVSGASDPRRLIARRGAARNTWLGLIAKVGARTRGALVGTSAAQQTGYKYTSASVIRQGDTPYTQMINRLTYMQAIAPNVMSAGMAKAQARIQWRLEQHRNKLEALWRT